MKGVSVVILFLLISSTVSLFVVKTAKSDPIGFSDEFETSTLDPRWTIHDEYGGSGFSLTSMLGYFTISTTSPPDRDLWQAINFYSPRIMQPIYGNFTIETKAWCVTTADIQSGGILVWKDQNNFLRLERAQRYDYQEILFIGTINGIWSMPSPEVSNPGAVLHIPNINPTYLRLIRDANVYLGYYSEDGLNWNFVANVTMETDYSLTAGLYNVNRGPPYFPSTAFTISFDYFRIGVPYESLSVSINPLSASINIGNSATFTSTVSGGTSPYSYQWYLDGNPVSGATSSSWTFTPTTSGIYYVYLKVTDDVSNTTQSETAKITVTSPPVGGYSIPIEGHTSAKPLTTYLTLIAVIAISFIVIRRKTTRDAR